MKYSSELTGAIGQLVCVLLLFIGNNKISGRTISNVRTDYSYEHLLTLSTCLTIQDRISRASEVFFPSDERYFQGIHHHTWSSSALSVCSVEPGISADVAIIMQLIRERRVPFGIKGGGHATNPNFSSTTGIHIVMRRLNSITYDSQEQTVRLGAGLVWLEVYKFLEPYNVTVNGGREGTAGVAGVTLGGGYGWKTNQYGLTMDSVIEYELVTPSGTIVHVNKNSYPDIFFGLKGGYNNFGIVTNFKMHVVPQRQIYGGILTYSIDNSTKFDRFINAAVNFQKNNQDARAQIELVFYIESGVLTIRLSAIYDGPSAPEHIYKEFVDIDHIGNLSTRRMMEFWSRSFSDNIRGRYHSVLSKELSTQLLKTIGNQVMDYYTELASKHDGDISILVLLQSSKHLEHSVEGAFNPRISSNGTFPICVISKWNLTSDDSIFMNATQSIADTLLKTMIADGQYNNATEQIIYPNFALETTPVSLIYGKNLPRLQNIRKTWDPENVMYLTGGWKI